MSKNISALFANLPEKKKENIAINIPDEVYNLLEHQKCKIEITETKPGEHTIYIVNNQNCDVVAITINPVFPENINNGFMRAYTKLKNITEGVS